jgi:hypothetical protein
MKILIDGQTLLTPEINRGIGTYFKNIVENVLENDFTNDFSPPSPDRTSRIFLPGLAINFPLSIATLTRFVLLRLTSEISASFIPRQLTTTSRNLA